MRAELHEVLEVRLRERSGIAHGLFWRDRAVRLDRQRQAIIVRALPNARLGDGKVGAAHRVVDGVDTNEVHRQSAIQRMLIRLDIPAALVHVQLDVQVAIILQGQDVVRRIDDANTRDGGDITRRDRTGAIALDVQDGILDVIREGERERLQVADDLVHVFDDTGNGLMLVHHAVDAHAPDGCATERRQQHATHCIAERVAEATLERLEPEFSNVGVVLALGCFNQLRTDKTTEIDRRRHDGKICSGHSSWCDSRTV